ncbi:hypothetical protein [Sphingobacterium sp. SYP-B4668]|uniref:hypothetical protein n=1 Tax=Sphingobacterium sp. SYP-B4668 TaxID=2996035 RepID=UPI0022DE5BA1|nr:hypothetical protein [Sphingobacterium sp. SYP-B4668]
MKRSLLYLLALALLTPISSYAQLDCPPVIGGARKANDKFHVTLGVGPTVLYGDVPKAGMGLGAYLKADYRIYKGIMVGLEGQIGSLKAEAVSDTTDKRKANNSYYAGFINVTVYPFQFTSTGSSYSSPTELLLNSIYLGVGFGGLQSKYKELRHADGFVDYGDGAVAGTARMPEKTKSMLFPVANVGAAIPINKFNYKNRTGRYFSVVFNGQFSFADDELDGFRVPHYNSKSNDMYAFYTVGARYSF